MPRINALVYITIRDQNGIKHEFGKKVPIQETVTGEVENKTFDIATSATVKVFDIDESPLGDFNVLAIEVDNDAIVEFVTDDDADVGEEVFTIGLKGGGVPLVIGRDESYANYTVNFGGGTLDVIETVRIKNLSGSNAVKAHVLIIT